MAIEIDNSLLRTYSGIDTSLVSDTDLNELKAHVIATTLDNFKIFETPTKVMEIGQGNNNFSYCLKKPFPLKILSCKIGTTEVDVNNVILNPITGMISLDTSNAINYTTFPRTTNSIKIKYLAGFLEKTEHVCETTSAITAGNNVTINVDDTSGLGNHTILLIESDTPRVEIVEVTSHTQTSITVDKVSHNHNTEALITKMDVADVLIQFIIYEICVAMAVKAIGSTYTFNTSYSKGSVNINKGVPYPHFEKVYNSNKKNRDEYYNLIKRKVSIIA